MNRSSYDRFQEPDLDPKWGEDEIEAHPQAEERNSYDRLMAAIEAQDGVNNDEADSFDPRDRF